MLRQLHSLTGIVPVAVFMLVQVGVLAKVTDGPQAFGEAGSWSSVRYARAGLALVLVPLAFHAIFGLFLTARTELSVTRHPYSGNWLHAMQRVTGVLTLAFIAYYGVYFWGPHAFSSRPARAYFELERALSTTHEGVPAVALAFLFGLAACAFHLGHGISSFATRWGMARSRKARSFAAAVGALTGIATFALAANAVLYLATGWRISGEERASPNGACGVQLEREEAPPHREGPAAEDAPPHREGPAAEDAPPHREGPAAEDAPPR
ncbi:MAG: hypothetical protein EXR75_13400 [Myxococcales bacterium]|nr:hypothetical protein [Myxococcales bacterium]